MSDAAEQSVDLANEISAMCEGRETVVVYLALSMMLGGMAALAERPDFDGMMALVRRGARSRIQRPLVDRHEQHLRIGSEDVVRPVAVVHVPVEDGDPQPLALRGLRH